MARWRREDERERERERDRDRERERERVVWKESSVGRDERAGGVHAKGITACSQCECWSLGIIYRRVLVLLEE
jgi:hypothetical protein